MRERERTVLTHYDIQQQRRLDRIEDWRLVRKELAKGTDLRMDYSPRRGINMGMLIGADAGSPTKIIDCRIIEIPPGRSSSLHRHTSDAILFVLEGQGYSQIGDKRVEWSPWDALHTPSRTWHRHFNPDPQHPARLVAFTDAPLLECLRLNRVEDLGDADPPKDPGEESLQQLAESVAGAGASSPYERDLLRAAAMERENLGATVNTRWSEVNLRVNKKGTRSAFMVDPTLGYQTSGLTMVLFQIAPGAWQAKHRHGGEAILYCVEGRGHSVVDDVKHPWQRGDGVLVGKWAWHQHFNADPDRSATIIRVHMWESMNTIMQLVLDPIVLYEEPPVLDAPDISKLKWTDGAKGGK